MHGSSSRPCRTPAWLRVAALTGLLAATAAASCDSGRRDDLLTGDAGTADSLSLSSPAFDHTVTSDDYRKWLSAEEALARVSGFQLADEIPLATATDEDVDRAADALEENEAVRLAIESAGLTVEEYVATTVALEQAYAATSPGTIQAPAATASSNLLLVDDHRADIERVRAASPLRSADSRDWGDRSERKGKGKGKDKGRGRKGKDRKD